MSKYELQKLFFKKSKKLLMTSFFWCRSRSWSRTLPVSVSKPKLRPRPVSVLVSENFCGLGLGLRRVGLDYSPVVHIFIKGGELSSQFRWFTIAKIELYFLIFFVLILGLRLRRYSTNTKRCPPKESFWKL